MFDLLDGCSAPEEEEEVMERDAVLALSVLDFSTIRYYDDSTYFAGFCTFRRTTTKDAEQEVEFYSLLSFKER